MTHQDNSGFSKSNVDYLLDKWLNDPSAPKGYVLAVVTFLVKYTKSLEDRIKELEIKENEK